MLNFSSAKVFKLSGTNLSLDDFSFIAKARPGEITLEILSSSCEKMKQSREVVLNIVKKGKPVYGINTGFGALASKQIETNDLEKLQYNLIRSHCTGVGRPFGREITRAIMLARANCLIQGFSGVTPETVSLLLDFINYDYL
jgi:histidine ammonia-lyase